MEVDDDKAGLSAQISYDSVLYSASITKFAPCI